MEILLTTITPVQHLIGKIVGIGWGKQQQFLGLRSILWNFGDSTGVFDFLSEGKNSQAIILAVICFVLGYLLYSVTAAILGFCCFLCSGSSTVDVYFDYSFIYCDVYGNDSCNWIRK